MVTVPPEKRDAEDEAGQQALRFLTPEQRRQLRKTYQTMMHSAEMQRSIRRVSDTMGEQLKLTSWSLASLEARVAMDQAVTQAFEPISAQLREQLAEVTRAQLAPFQKVVRDTLGGAGPDPFGMRQLQRELTETLLNRHASHLSSHALAQLSAQLVEVQLDQSLPDPDAEKESVREQLAAEYQAIDSMVAISRRQPRDASNQARLAKAALASSVLEGVRPSPSTVKQLLLLVLEEDVQAEEAAVDQAEAAIRARVEMNRQRNAES